MFKRIIIHDFVTLSFDLGVFCVAATYIFTHRMGYLSMNCRCLSQGIASSLLMKMMISALFVEMGEISCAVMDVQGLSMDVGFMFLS